MKNSAAIILSLAMMTATAVPAAAQDSYQDMGQNGMTFDLDGGSCDSDVYAYFNVEGMVMVETGSRYVGDGDFYLESPSSVTVRKDGLVAFDAVSMADGSKVTWLVDPDGYFTSSEGYDASTIRTEGAVDVGRLSACNA